MLFSYIVFNTLLIGLWFSPPPSFSFPLLLLISYQQFSRELSIVFYAHVDEETKICMRSTQSYIRSHIITEEARVWAKSEQRAIPAVPAIYGASTMVSPKSTRSYASYMCVELLLGPQL